MSSLARGYWLLEEENDELRRDLDRLTEELNRANDLVEYWIEKASFYEDEYDKASIRLRSLRSALGTLSEEQDKEDY
ncbi:hypothetical protein [Actinopolyspora erythraea]|uniref:hypothetical protein n=1 Tax=Actinopolyspora erythraea TaxID=414996 RepID=UPI001184AF88|nr:hypothetical protein [Actinopolyspora erythraea]